MKKIYSLSFLLAAGVFVIPQEAHSFMTFDATATMEAVSSNSMLVQQYSKIKEATKTASDVSNSIGAAGKTFSELTIDKAKEAENEAERLKKEADRIKELRSDVERRQAELQGKKDLIASEVEKAKAYRESMKDISGDVLGKSGEYGAGGNPYDVPESEETYDETYDETYNEEEILTPPSQDNQQEEVVEEVVEETIEETVEDVVEKPLPGRQEFGKGEEKPLAEDKKTEEELLKEELDKKEGSALENYGNPEAKGEEESEDDGSAVENYGDIEENKDGQAVENYGDPEKDYSKDNAVKGDKPSSSVRGGKVQDVPSKPKVPSRGRKPFQKTSFYKNYELIASADVDKSKTVVYDGTYKGRFVIPKRFAEKCKINLNEAKETINVEECIITMLKEMNNQNASAAEDARKEYVNIIRDWTVGTVAVAVKAGVESAEFEDTTTKPLAEDVTSAGNTRDDISANSLVKLKGGTEVVNKLTETTAHRLKLDAMRQLGYHKVEDTKDITKKDDGKSDGEDAGTGK